ncbi:MAG: hypothetical protein P4L62_01245 [Candidatus Pacebacteria bacterium]|nr:hypothetical protein [Candidatus Paceibacterota bacterium]MDR3582973.1 hypothetical protein [Candidatus Paceibacterota bacterium]
MDLNINGENLKNFFKWSNVREGFFDFLGRWAKLLLLLLAVAGTAYCVYLWYIFIYNPGWSDVQKQHYIQTKGQGVVFDQAKFNALVTVAKNRDVAEKQALTNVLDIFRLKSLIVPPGASDSSTTPAANPPANSATTSDSSAAPVAKSPASSPPVVASPSGN